MKIVFIVGNANSGKSTLIRNLTGIRQGKEENWKLSFEHGDECIYVRNAAVQEYNEKDEAGFLEELNRISGTHFLAIIPLRRKRRKNFEKGESYINYVLPHYEIKAIIKLDSFRFDNHAIENLSHDLSINEPRNKKAAFVRNLIGLI